jgi:hypothetical protein
VCFFVFDPDSIVFETKILPQSLGLGLFEQQGIQPANGDTSSSSSDSGTSSENDDDGSNSTTSTSSDDGDDSSSEDDNPQPDLISLVTGIRPILPLPKSRRRQRTTEAHHPGIVMLDSSSDAVAGSDQVDP